jgi:Family of unknown function (DUF6600)/FecR protein
MNHKHFITALIILALVFLSLQIVRAQDQPSQESATDQTDQQDATAPSVARISLVEGSVSTMAGDAGEWVATTVNAPVQRGDKISTSDRSRSEIQLDYANVLRLDQQSQANVADLTRSRIQLQLSQGNANFDVLEGSESEAEIDTPNVAVHPSQAGSYRIQIDPDSGDTTVTVRKGQAEVSTPQGSTTVDEGQMITIEGTDNPQYQVNDAPAGDEWDRWNQDRDKEILNAQSWKHTDKYYTGTQDLDRNGQWKSVPGYGDVWSPNVGSDWAPYQDGRWVWQPYYGWTWVSYEPWGWAPYHYGRWFDYDNSWYWWPGPVYSGYYPTWGPAYVSFFGFGRGDFSFGFGYRSIGWCALGPHDSYYPWYGRGFHNTYNSVNFNFSRGRNNFGGRQTGRAMPPLARGNRYPRMSNIQSAYSNPRGLRGFTTVSTQDFRNGRVPRNSSRISSSQLRQAQMIRGGIPASPTRQSFSPTGRTVARSVTAGRNQTFFSSNRASRAGSQRFSARTSSNNSSRFANRVGSAASPRSGWQRFGASNSPRAFTNDNVQSRRNGVAQSSRAQSQARPTSRQAPANGWQRFSQHPAPAARTQGNFSAPRSQQAPSGWSRSNNRPANSAAPRSNYRPPAGMNKPIVTQRAPRGYSGSGRSAPSGGYNGGGRNAAPPRSYNGGGRSAPSGGYNGGGRNAAPPRSYNGGGRAAPSGGYNGGGRSVAPSRGYSGGGRSAPSSNYSAPRGGGSRGASNGGGNRGGGSSRGGSGGDHRH